MSQDDIELLRTGKRPAEFIELEDADPREFFGDDQKLVSTYLPSHLLKRIHGNTESENGVQ